MLLVLQKFAENSIFDDVVQDVCGRCPPIDLPWLSTELGLTDIQQRHAQMTDKCQLAADSDSKRSDKFVMSTVDSGKLAAAAAGCKHVADYSHLYVYKRNAGVTAPRSHETEEYIALSSSSSSDEDESGCQRIAVVDTLTASSVTAADSTPATSVHSAKYSKLYRSPNTGVQIANPNKKRKKKRSLRQL